MSAVQEQAAGLPLRPLLSRADAMAKANAYLRLERPLEVAVSAIPNPLQGLWILDHQDASNPGESLVGDGPLIVPTTGNAYIKGSVPDWPELIGAELPESHEDTWLPEDWTQELGGEFEKDYWHDLLEFVAKERGALDVYPPPSQTFAAFEKTKFDEVKVVILGQDPYHGPGQAQGIAFSIPETVRPKPPSLRRIHAALKADLGIEPPEHGNLEGWAQQGVLLLNTTMTVRDGKPGSHQNKGWETFTDEVIRAIGSRPGPVVFLLWGRSAQAKRKLIEGSAHEVIVAAHPQARANAKNPLHGVNAFSRTNQLLKEAGPIDWGQFEVSSAPDQESERSPDS